MYLIQTRTPNNTRRPTTAEIYGGITDPKEWVNLSQFEDFNKAKSECISLIETGKFRASHVRLVEVVCTFNAEIKVMSKDK